MWLEQRRAKTNLDVSPIGLAQSNEWHQQDGSIRHNTGGFFEISGLKASSAVQCLHGIQQPIINQPEVGILGFIVAAKGHGKQWLLQAKPEPGNVHGVQLAPTVQATFSNYSRKHGGAPTLFLQFFTSGSISFESDTLQSEQGTRFFQKYNRNAVVSVPFAFACPEGVYRWHGTRTVRKLLVQDYAINTDARSVMVSAPWHLVSSQPMPFLKSGDKGWPELRQSYTHPQQSGIAKSIAWKMAGVRRALSLKTEHVSLENLPNWQIKEDKISHCGSAAFDIGFYRVNAPTREKPKWDQPLLRSLNKDQIVLFAQRQQGVLRFMLRFSLEIGLAGGAELGPSYKRESRAPAPQWLQEMVDQQQGVVRARVEQSDEGGRFMRSICEYSVVELAEDQAIENDPLSMWVTLGELETIAKLPKILTNEARSAISLLLSYA